MEKIKNTFRNNFFYYIYLHKIKIYIFSNQTPILHYLSFHYILYSSNGLLHYTSISYNTCRLLTPFKPHTTALSTSMQTSNISFYFILFYLSIYLFTLIYFIYHLLSVSTLKITFIWWGIYFHKIPLPGYLNYKPPLKKVSFAFGVATGRREIENLCFRHSFLL